MRTGFFLSLSLLALPVGGIVHAVEFIEVQEIFTSRCKDCHMEGKSKGGLALDADKISKEIGKSKAIVPGDADKSDLVKLLLLKEGEDDRMPPKGPPLTEAEVNKIKTWIGEGAKLPESADAKDGKEKPESKTGEAAAPETWTAGGKSVTATLMRVDVARKSILLKMEDGRTREVFIRDLDEDSKARAKAFWEKNK